MKEFKTAFTHGGLTTR